MREFCENPNCGKKLEPSTHMSPRERKQRDKKRRYCDINCSNEHRGILSRGKKRAPPKNDYELKQCPHCGDDIPKVSRNGHPISYYHYQGKLTCGKTKCNSKQHMLSKHKKKPEPLKIYEPPDIVEIFCRMPLCR